MTGDGLSPLSFLVGTFALAVVVVALGLAARRLRRRYLPGWEAAPALLADVITGVALLIMVAELLGTFALLRRWALVAACVLVGVIVVVTTRRAAPPTPHPPPATPPPSDRVTSIAAMVVSAALVGLYVARTLTVLEIGMDDFDSLDYHLPHAVEFAQDHTIWHLHHLSPEFPTNLHPYNAELVHATGMVAFGRDLLSPLLNLGWLGLALLAGWCVGRPWGKAPLTLLGVAIVLFTPVLTRFQPGSAQTDVVSLGLLIAALALVLQPERSRARLVVAGAAAGLGLGTKLTLLAPIAALTLGLLLIARRERWRALVAWGLPLAATGGYWFVRNVVATGSPLPSLRLGFIPSPRFDRVEDLGFRVTDYLTDGEVWRRWFLPGLEVAMGGWWWAIVALAVLGMALALLRGGELVKVITASGVVAVVAYLFTPTTAGGLRGHPTLFSVNLRYLFPALVVGLVLLPLAPGLASRAVQRVLLVIQLGVVVVTATGGGRVPGMALEIQPLSDRYRPAGLLAAALVIAVGLAFPLRRRAELPRSLLAGGLVVATVASLALGWAVQRRYFNQRWHFRALYDWGDDLEGRRVGVQGLLDKYPLYGRDLDNHVEYVGDPGPRGEFHQLESCPTWRDSVAVRDLDFLVVRQRTAFGTDALAWTRSDPAAQEVFSAEGTTVFRMSGPSDASTCD
jgi:hypothetical protein